MTIITRGSLSAWLLTILFTSSGMAQRLPAPDAPTAAAPAVTEPVRRTLPALDLAGGITFVRLAPGADLDRTVLPGWQLSIGAQPFSRLGFVAEVASARRTDSVSDILRDSGGAGPTAGRAAEATPAARVRLRQTSFLVGPSVRLLQRGRLSSRIRALIGVSHVSAAFSEDSASGSVASGDTPRAFGAFEDEATFAAAFGTAWDVRASRTIAVRLHPTLMLTRLDGETQVTPRFATSLVWWIRPPQGRD